MAKTNRSFSKLKRKLAPHLALIYKLAAAVLILSVFVLIALNLQKLVRKLSLFTLGPRTALSLIQSPETILNHTNGRTNLLILGKGGAGHEAPDLTDTIIFLSYHHQTNSLLMLSLPRDIWIDSLRAKLNSAYFYGNQKQLGGGVILAKAAVEEVIDQPIHYTLVVDFDSFIQAVDLLGGIDINVARSFDDFKYPIPGKENAQPESARYETLSFDQGLQTMDGVRALKYVRSRNAKGDEGTDYARANRQQQVILSLQKKVLSSQVFTKPKKISQLINIFTQAVETNIVNGDITGFIKIALKFDSSRLTTQTLDQGDEDSGREGLLINPPVSQFGQWVLTGKDNSWQQVQDHVSKLLSKP